MARHRARSRRARRRRQQQILSSAARLVRPGGRLVYATCSRCCMRRTRRRPKAFLAAEPEFSVVPAARAWAETIGGALAGRRALSQANPGTARHRRVLCRHIRAPTMSDRVLILDFGSQVTQLIARRVRESGVYCEIHPFTIAEGRLARLRPASAIILSGGPASRDRRPQRRARPTSSSGSACRCSASATACRRCARSSAAG